MLRLRTSAKLLPMQCCAFVLLSTQTQIKMDLTKFKFPEMSGVDMAFPTIKTDKQLLAEAKERGFYDGNTPYNRLFSNLFFSGGKIKFKEGLDEDFKNRAWSYCRSFMQSWEPKHEEKEAICTLIMSELLEPNTVTA